MSLMERVASHPEATGDYTFMLSWPSGAVSVMERVQPEATGDYTFMLSWPSGTHE
jgi:hypothetical protein